MEVLLQVEVGFVDGLAPSRTVVAHRSLWVENGAMRRTALRAGLLAAMFAALAGAAMQGHSQLQAPARAAAWPPEQRIDINHARLDELLKVPGLSRVWAARIVRFRPYRTKEDLLDKGILSSAVYDRIKDFVIAHRDKPPTAAPQN
jgi:DNA uptake protein ComE-like DNA-binding protein